MELDGPPQRVELLNGGHLAARAQLGTAVTDPALDVGPGQLVHVAVEQAGEAAVDAQHREVVVDAQAHGRTRRRVHPRGQAAGVDDGDPLGAVGGRRRRARVSGRLGGRRGHGLEQLEHPAEAGPAGLDRPEVVVGGHEVLDGAGGCDLLHHRQAADAVVALGDDDRLAARIHGHHLAGGGAAQQCGHPAVVGAGAATALDVPQDGDTGGLTQLVGDDLADVVGGDAVALAVGGALGDDHHGLAAPGLAARLELGAHVLLPVLARGELGDQDVVTAPGHGRHEGQVAAVAAHDLHDEGALVGGGRRGDVVDGLQDAVEGRVGADGHVGAHQVVVDAAHQAGDHEDGMGGGRLCADITGLDELLEQGGPVLAELVGAGQGAVAPDDHEPVDAVLQEVAGGRQLAGALAELSRAGGADDGAAALEDGAHRVPLQGADAVTPGHGPGPALHDRVGPGPQTDGGAHHGPHGRVHALGVTAGGEDPDAQGLAVQTEQRVGRRAGGGGDGV